MAPSFVNPRRTEHADGPVNRWGGRYFGRWPGELQRALCKRRSAAGSVSLTLSPGPRGRRCHGGYADGRANCGEDHIINPFHVAGHRRAARRDRRYPYRRGREPVLRLFEHGSKSVSLFTAKSPCKRPVGDSWCDGPTVPGSVILTAIHAGGVRRAWHRQETLRPVPVASP